MISIAHSPDSDDYFMFWAMRTGILPGPIPDISFTPLNTEELNLRSCHGEFDVTAASVGALPHALKHYDVLSHGASVGRGYGPRVISNKISSLGDLSDKVIGIPGALTTAALVLRLVVPRATYVEVPIVPYQRIFEEIDSGRIDAALLIHEGQFVFDSDRYTQLLDIGVWWKNKYNLPLPLGVNLIRRDLDSKLKAQLSSSIASSIEYGIQHLDKAVPYLATIAKETNGPLLSYDELRAYLASYANQDSLKLDQACRDAIQILLQCASVNKDTEHTLSIDYFD